MVLRLEHVFNNEYSYDMMNIYHKHVKYIREGILAINCIILLNTY